MKVSVLCIGDELLRGSTTNTNLAKIGQSLGAAAMFPVMEMAVKDNGHSIVDALDILFDRSDIIISTGGLGPTSDDVTKTTVAEYFGLKLKNNAEVAKKIKSFWSVRRLGKMPPSVLNQALVPVGARILENRTGTAPGLIVKNLKSGKTVIMLPGPPHEMSPMLEDFVVPYLKSVSKDRLYTEMVYVSGLPESSVEEKVAPLVSSEPELSIAYCASPESIKVFLSGKRPELVAVKMKEIKGALKDNLLLPGARSIAEDIYFLLKKRKHKLCVAESCTGGMIAAALTDIPGSSEVFSGSAVVYSNDWKMKVLGVDKATLNKYGAVSSQCAGEMVDNVCARYDADAGIAVTGIAGPAGGTESKPVGLVFIATRYDGKTVVRQYNFPGTRDVVRRRAVSSALNQLRRQILSRD
ncbi:MAG: CinA family nicotinamide mononucleotide deamidase-related protein [Victivallales bacterium]|jgi:nicotinamide-nucleotide amidase